MTKTALYSFIYVSLLCTLVLPNLASAEVCSASAPNGTCPANQHCQVTSMDANNQGVYACVDNINTGECGSSYPNGCPSGLQCVSGGSGEFDCVGSNSPLLSCTSPDPSNTVQTCSCTQYTSGYSWQCVPRASAQSGDYSCYNFVNGQCVNWVQTSTKDASSGNDLITYTPLEPLPGLEKAQSGTGDFASLIQGFFTLLLNLALFFAVTTFVIGGITYMFSESAFKKNFGKERVQAAMWGLVILAGAWLILHTINPQLTVFNSNLLGPTTPSTGSSGTSAQKTNSISNLEQLSNNCEARGGYLENTSKGPSCKLPNTTP